MAPASPKKRIAGSPARRGGAKKSKIVKLIPDVIDALAQADAEVLPADFRTLLKTCLPVTLAADKAERDAWENEVVAKGEEALNAILKSLEAKHADKLTAQNEVIAPAQHNERTNKKAAAEESLAAAKTKHEASKETCKEAGKAVHEADKAVKNADKESTSAAKEAQAVANKKAVLDGALATEFALLRDGSSAGAAGKKAVDKVLKIGKEYGCESSILETFPISCKKAADARSDFEKMMFSTFEEHIKQGIEGLAKTLADAEAAKEAKAAALAAAKQALEDAKAAEEKASAEEKECSAAEKEAKKELAAADKSLYDIWSDMKKVCDAQDAAAAALNHFKDHICGSYEKLKNKEPEPEVVPEPEVPEMSLDPTAETAAPVAEAAPPAPPAEDGVVA